MRLADTNRLQRAANPGCFAFGLFVVPEFDFNEKSRLFFANSGRSRGCLPESETWEKLKSQLNSALYLLNFHHEGIVMYRFLIPAIALAMVSTGVLAQDTYQEWAAAGKPDRPKSDAPGAPSDVRGGATVFGDRASFDAAVGALPLEDFDGGATAAGALGVCTEPVSSASDDDCFSPGDLIAGFEVTSSSGGGVVVLGDGFIGQSTAVVGASAFADITTVSFTEPDVDAVGFDAYSGSGGSLSVEVRVFDGGGALADTVNLTTSADNVSEFFGILAPGPISRVEIETAEDGGELFDNLAFGVAEGGGGDGEEESFAIPTLGTTGVIVGILLLLALGGFTVRARNNG